MKLFVFLCIAGTLTYAATPVFECGATSSWNHESNFKTVVKKTDKWEPVSGTIQQYDAKLNFETLDGRIQTYAVARIGQARSSRSTGLLVSIVTLDKKLGIHFSTYAENKLVNSSVQLPDLRSTANQVDIICKVN
tara:strand:- start:19429 stop:19833 length:405 start_codon:yes stop_codon:yes gene_type:complete